MRNASLVFSTLLDKRTPGKFQPGILMWMSWREKGDMLLAI